MLIQKYKGYYYAYMRNSKIQVIEGNSFMEVINSMLVKIYTI